jgi:hypothetical protein
MITVNRASLTISSPTIDAATMTRRLGIEPSGSPESRADFDARHHTRWILHFTDEGDGGSELQGGFAALRKLLNTVLPRLAELDSLRAEGVRSVVVVVRGLVFRSKFLQHVACADPRSLAPAPRPAGHGQQRGRD